MKALEEDIKVSVIIPVYKVERYLRDCLDSVLGQSMREIEVICVDDASPDRCPEILDEYAAGDPRITVIHLEENKKQGYGRNLGIERARGRYIYLLDSDDMITPDALERLYCEAEKDDTDIIFFDLQTVFEKEEFRKKLSGSIPPTVKPLEGRIYEGPELFDIFIKENSWICYIQRQFIKRELLTENGILFPEDTEHEDELFSFEAVLSAKRVKCLGEPFFIRRYRDDSVMTRKPSLTDFKGYFKTLVLMSGFMEEKGINSVSAYRNLGRIRERAVKLFRDFDGKEDLESCFAEERFTGPYRFMSSLLRSDAYIRGFADALEPFIQGKKLYIYGAGLLADRVWRSLALKGFAVEGFFVTDTGGNPGNLWGRPVAKIRKAAEDDRDALVIVAVMEGYFPEISEILECNGWEYIFYKGRRPEGL